MSQRSLWSPRAASTPSVPRMLAGGLVDGAVNVALWQAGRRATGAPSLFDDADGPQDRDAARLDAALVVANIAVTVSCDLLLGGRTAGRLVTGTRLVDRRGRPPGPAAAVLRESWPSAKAYALARVTRRLSPENRGAGLAIQAGVGLVLWILPMRDPRRRSIGDLIAGTRLAEAGRS